MDVRELFKEVAALARLQRGEDSILRQDWWDDQEEEEAKQSQTKQEDKYELVNKTSRVNQAIPTQTISEVEAKEQNAIQESSREETKCSISMTDTKHIKNRSKTRKIQNQPKSSTHARNVERMQTRSSVETQFWHKG